MNDFERKQIADETRRICKTGKFVLPSKEEVDITKQIKLTKEETKFYGEKKLLTIHQVKKFETRFAIVDATSIAVARRVAKYAESEVGVLNFASGHYPGGGFEHGRDAQEEHLCRLSALYPCLKKCKSFYNLANPDFPGLNSDNIIISNHVPVFRDDDEKLTKNVFTISIVSAVAVNQNVVLKHTTKHDDNAQFYSDAMQQRCERILTAFLFNGSTHIVLGAFGCGVFKNDPHHVANCFLTLLKKQFKTCFEEVIFAVPFDPFNLAAFQYAFRKLEKKNPALVLFSDEGEGDEGDEGDAYFQEDEGDADFQGDEGDEEEQNRKRREEEEEI